ncbi:MAG: SDR family NAD(P)-dependent oxidoreductase [Solirubrobacterales bacterium]|nr:SDR family NAD(P)-dependent oxidoreductase [Solirubrobacterales bacterium]
MAKQAKQLSGKVAVVTGATGAVGSSLARKLVQRGVKVAMADLSQEKLDEVAASIGTPDVLPMALDVSDRVAYTRYLDEVERRLGPVDFLCNVAAIMPISAFDEERDEMSQRILDVNLGAIIFSTKDAARRMKQRGSGHIVNVASGASWLAGGGVATYCASKFGLLGYSEAVKMELRGSGVEISVVVPAVIKSDMSKGLKDVRGVRAVDPSEVADGIIRVLERPKFAEFVPPAIGVMSLGFSAVPYKLRHMLTRLSRTDLLLLQADQSKRVEYESRVASQLESPSGETDPAGEKAHV